eukprot:9461923-Lingulodinium_polyedra.AAC.1
MPCRAARCALDHVGAVHRDLGAAGGAPREPDEGPELRARDGLRGLRQSAEPEALDAAVRAEQRNAPAAPSKAR